MPTLSRHAVCNPGLARILPVSLNGKTMTKSIISDMDGVIYRGKQLIPGATEFVDRLLAADAPFLFLTNNAEQTPLDLKLKLEHLGIKV